MDLNQLEAYLRPQHLPQVQDWSEGWAWLAGGTWLFSEPQPGLRTLVDLEPLGWSELEVTEAGLSIGATCSLAKLSQFDWPAAWPACAAFRSAISALAASFKVIHLATVGGNLCLALPVGTMAPVMLALGATYEVWSPSAPPFQLPALGFQTGPQQTRLQPGQVLRQITIPAAQLRCQVDVQRFGLAATDPALALVVGTYDPQTAQVQLALGACLPAPYLLQFSGLPSAVEIAQALDAELPLERFVHDARASAGYRRQLAQVLIQRCLEGLRC